MSLADHRGAVHAFRSFMEAAKRDCADADGEIRPARFCAGLQREDGWMTPTTGRTVLYTLTELDAAAINRRRTNGSSIAERMKVSVMGDGGASPAIYGWPAGAQAHIGNEASAGDVVPLVVVRVWPNEFGEGIPGVNGQAFLDGNDALWVTSAREGTEPGTWAWPARV